MRTRTDGDDSKTQKWWKLSAFLKSVNNSSKKKQTKIHLKFHEMNKIDFIFLRPKSILSFQEFYVNFSSF